MEKNTNLRYTVAMPFPVELSEHFLEIAKRYAVEPDAIHESHTHGGGHGGQKVNKSTNCVELNHEPTGIAVRVHHHRGLQQNRKEAYELLLRKIDEYYVGVQEELDRMAYQEKRSSEPRHPKVKRKILQNKKRKSVVKKLRKSPADYEESA